MMNTNPPAPVDESLTHPSPVAAAEPRAETGPVSTVSHDLLEDTDSLPGVKQDLRITMIDNRPTTRAHRILFLHTPRGKIESHYYPVKGGAKAVLYTGGVGPRQESPASNCYPHLADEMQHRRLAGLRLKHRLENDPDGMIYDMRIGIQFLYAEGFREFALIGPSMGTESVLETAMLEPAVTAVGLFSVGKTTSAIENLGPHCRLLTIHGGRDSEVSGAYARLLHERASEPKEFFLLPRSTNSLNENSVDVQMRTREWLLTWMRS